MLNTELAMNSRPLATSAHKETTTLFKPIPSNISDQISLCYIWHTLMSSILLSMEAHYLGYFVP